MESRHLLRITIAVIGFISVFVLPTWVPVVCIIVLALRYRAWEAILIGALIDMTWLPSLSLSHSLPLYTILGVIVVWGFEPLRQQFLLAS